MKISINKLSDAWVLKDFKYWKKVTGKIPKTEKEAQQIIKSIVTKIEICETLEGRKEKEQDIINSFFPDNNLKKKHKFMYKVIIKNLKKMELKQLEDVHNAVFELNHNLKSPKSK
jgi:hypothetical protein